jgi:predicted membrane metal-binding protein
VATILGVHSLVVVGYAGWIMTWPKSVRTSTGFTMPRGLLAFFLTMGYVAPAIAVSITVSCVSLVALRSLRRWSGTAAGVVAALIGMAVTAAVTVVLIAWRN